ncbi:hypothetical protein BKA70DRAFT_1339781 [Coprinopsis sp. MPI-PUGE-AT-0042]|nr:hypothetical protein BKA70DRAFT_1339781 [Coprinopsis sp. MPI-PUGE-AT-0042]
MVELGNERESSLRTSSRLNVRRDNGARSQDWSFLRGKSKKDKEMPQVKEELKFDVKQEAENKDRKVMVEQSTSENLKQDPPCSSEGRVKKEEKGAHDIKNESKAAVEPSNPEQSATVVEALEEEMAVDLALPAAHAEAPKPSQRSSRNERKEGTTGASAQGLSQKVTAKREACPNVLTAPRRTKVDESVAVRQESPAPQPLTPEEKEAKEHLWRSKISKKVKSEHLRFDLNVLWSRLVAAKIPPDLFPITLDREIRDVCVSRVFLSKTWGGGFVATFPTICEEKFNQHGLNDFMFPGLVLSLEFQRFLEHLASGSMLMTTRGHGGENTIWMETRLCVCSPALFTRGQYRSRAARTLTADEWRQQKGRGSAGKMKKDMTKEEIQLGMTRGDVVKLWVRKWGVYTMECVAYDEDLSAAKTKSIKPAIRHEKEEENCGEGQREDEHYSGEEEETSDIEGEGDSEDKGRPRLV